MGKYRYLLFDMDGTLVDSSKGIFAAVQYAQKKLGLQALSESQLRLFLGPPLVTSFKQIYSMSEPEAVQAAQVFRVYYSKIGMFQCDLYTGVSDTLRLLEANGYVLFVATSKPTLFAAQIAQKHGIINFFSEIVGSNLDNSRGSKREVIQYILDKFSNIDLSAFLMIGDKKHDLLGAAACGIRAVGVTYGYGSREELAKGEKVGLLNSLQELPAWLQMNNDD